MIEVTEGWKKLHIEELHDLYSRINKSRMRSAGNVTRFTEKRNAYRILVGKPDGRKQGRPRR
jgi:hypothetical protein